ncbi:MAG: metallophosphoesterase [Chlorobi bacterium]|nr:metallophosphoesterase [Chlorobiota bacterium]MCI0716603.1 metallophosphoesterase [Chlorobiota bacterium]
MWRLLPLIIIGLQLLVYFTFINYLKTTRIYKPSHRWWALVPFVLFNVSFIVINLTWGRNFAPPLWFKYAGVYPFYIWMAATFFISLWLLIGKLIKLPFKIPVWIAKLIKPLRKKIGEWKEHKAIKRVDLSRRKFVRYVTMGVSTYAFGGAAYGMIRHDAYRIEHKDIKIANLPEELKGTTITLICDIHAGQYMDENDMREYAEIVNEMNSDIICIPGDFVNFDVRDIHPLAKAFRDMKAKYGVYGSLGNHDFFQDVEYVAKGIINESPVTLLRNDAKKITIKGKDLYIIGVDDTRGAGAYMPEVIKYYESVENNLKQNDPNFNNAPKVLLCHKPYGFDALAQKEIDLVLAGHTHGGQVVPIKFGNFNLSFAATVSKYIEGLYKIGKSNMYVSRGIGTVGLPIRINCPPEITKIKLV